nr:ribosome silencing factor [Celeribacter marinus]
MSRGTSTKFGGQLMLDFVTHALDQEKAEDIVTIDLRGKSQIADFMVICSGRSSRQVGALAEKISDLLKQQHGVLTRIEGKGQGDWVLMDAGDVVVHIFRPEVREFYQLEKMWLPTDEAATKATKS